jgi:signal transduction histidine kinase/CheY-like chemotaxis protein
MTVAEKTGYAIVAEGRAKQLKVRLITALIIAVAVGMLLPSWLPVIWLSVVFGFQWLDHLMYRPFRRNPSLVPSRVYQLYCNGFVFFHTIIYDLSALYLWLYGGDVGKAFAMVQVCGGLLHVSQNMRRQPSLFYSGGLAHGLYLIGMPTLELATTQPLAMIFPVIAGCHFMGQIITAVQESNAETKALEAAKIRAEEASQAKSDFLTTISHEIRTPMNAVISAGILLKRTSLTPEQASHLSMMTHASDALLGLLNDVLDLSRIEGGKLTITDADLDLNEMLNALVALWRPQLIDKGCVLILDLDPDVPQAIRADALRLRQILFNLLSNAVKFTERGHVILRVRFRGEDRLCFEVEDTGCGIPDEALTRLFNSFEQVDSSTTRRHGGSGLGLAISRNLATLMGGSLDVTTQFGRGSVFRLDLPHKPIIGPQFPEDRRRLARDMPSSVPTPVRMERLRVLVAEDHEVNRKIMGLFLDPMGCDVVFAVNGAQAVELAQESEFNAIFLDMQMPIMDGLEAARNIRAEGPNRRSPIIALTANVLMSHRLAWSEVGADAFLAKPLDPNLLVATLNQVMNANAEMEPVQAA